MIPLGTASGTTGQPAVIWLVVRVDAHDFARTFEGDKRAAPTVDGCILESVHSWQHPVEHHDIWPHTVGEPDRGAR